MVIPVPAGVSLRDAACAPIAFGTVEHMLFDNAKLKPGETILVHAGGSGIGSVAIKMAKALGCTVITTVGDDAKAEKAKALGADHVINYKTERFEGVTRKLTAKKGVDVVFEHVGGEGFNGSLLCLKRGGRLVTCGSTAGPTVTINLMQLFQQQYKIFGSFGASMRNIRDSLSKIAAGMAPIIDTEVALSRFRTWPGPTGKPSGIRQGDRELLKASAMRRMIRRLRRSFKRASDALIGALAIGLLKRRASDRPGQDGRFRRLGDAYNRPAYCRKIELAAPILIAAFPEKSKAEIDTILRGCWDNLGRMGAEFAHLDRLWDFDPEHPTDSRIELAQPDIERFHRLLDDGKPALIFAAHLANWELPAICAATYKLDSAVLYRRPNIPGIDQWLTRPGRPAWAS